jgi:hypothetical protein
MAQYRKKPVVIEAVSVDTLLVQAQYDFKNLPDYIRSAYDKGAFLFLADTVNIKTLEGWMTGNKNDMIIRGVAGELYPCKPEIFEATYEAA